MLSLFSNVVMILHAEHIHLLNARRHETQTLNSATPNYNLKKPPIQTPPLTVLERPPCIPSSQLIPIPHTLSLRIPLPRRPLTRLRQPIGIVRLSPAAGARDALAYAPGVTRPRVACGLGAATDSGGTMVGYVFDGEVRAMGGGCGGPGGSERVVLVDAEVMLRAGWRGGWRGELVGCGFGTDGARCLGAWGCVEGLERFVAFVP
jgi:hypothetical protein